MKYPQACRLYQAASAFYEKGLTNDPELRRVTEEEYCVVNYTYLENTCATVFRVIAEKHMRFATLLARPGTAGTE